MNEITDFKGRKTQVDTDGHAVDDLASFITKVGERVRDARARKGISRRVLSELSGVSQRYLAQLESGSGNISIALLRKVANALDHRIEWFVGDEDPWTSETALVTDLYRMATAEQRRKVMDVLDCENPQLRRAQRVALIGLRGAGKSTLGKLVGEAHNVPFLELNQEIESASGMPVSELIAFYGQEGYRKLEQQSLERIVEVHDNVILAVAGGIVAEPETYAFLLRHYHTIWLRAKPEEHLQRVRAQGDERPMAGNPAALEELRTILTSREALYAKAQAEVNTSGKSIDETAQQVFEAISNNGFLVS